MKNKRKPILIAVIVVAVLAAAAAGLWFFWLKDYLAVSNAAPVYVNSVSAITGFDTGSNPRYSGIVEPQETYTVSKDDTKKIDAILVKEGDEVHAGDILFRYNTQEIQWDLDQANLDLQGIANQISATKKHKEELEAEKANASKDDQYSYTVQIQNAEVQIKQYEYDSSVKNSEINKLEKSLANAEVFCETDGVIKEINESPGTDATGKPLPFISILSSGEFRIKGTVSELNLSTLSEGQAVLVYSRVDKERVWQGTVESIEMEPAENQTDGFFYGMDNGDKSSKYDFYVTLENLDGLILGQHVYIELDLGGSKKEGIWLPSVYVDRDEHGSFVWARSEKQKLEKRTVFLGEYDDQTDQYEIKSGISTVDYIAYPDESLMEGMPTTIDAAAQLPAGNGPADGNLPSGMDIPEGGMENGGIMEGGTENGGFVEDGTESGGFVEDGAENGGIVGSSDDTFNAPLEEPAL